MGALVMPKQRESFTTLVPEEGEEKKLDNLNLIVSLHIRAINWVEQCTNQPSSRWVIKTLNEVLITRIQE